MQLFAKAFARPFVMCWVFPRDLDSEIWHIHSKTQFLMFCQQKNTCSFMHQGMDVLLNWVRWPSPTGAKVSLYSRKDHPMSWIQVCYYLFNIGSHNYCSVLWNTHPNKLKKLKSPVGRALQIFRVLFFLSVYYIYNILSFYNHSLLTFLQNITGALFTLHYLNFYRFDIFLFYDCSEVWKS